MLHARKDYDRIQDPENKIPNDEPVFLLRGQDILAPELLEIWANALLRNHGDPKMAEMVFQHAEKMKLWQARHTVKLPDLPKSDSVTF